MPCTCGQLCTLFIGIEDNAELQWLVAARAFPPKRDHFFPGPLHGIHIPVPRNFPGFRRPGLRHPGIRVPRYLRGSLVRFWTHRNSSPTIFARFSMPRNSSPTIFARVSTSRNSCATIFARFSRNSSPTIFAMVSTSRHSSPTILARVSTSRNSSPTIFARFSRNSSPTIFARFSTRKDKNIPVSSRARKSGVLRLYYKSRLSSHGSSGCPRRTTSVLQKSTFQPRKLRGRPWRTTFVRQNSIFQPRKSPAYYVCTTQVEKNRNNTTVLAPRPRENPQRGYVCMSRNAKTRRFWHRANAETRRGVTFVCQETQKHDGFGTAPTPKPAEGVRAREKKYQTRRF